MISVRLKPELETLLRDEAERRAVSVSDLVREHLGGGMAPGALTDDQRVEDLERRLARLEEMAGL